ncbi:tetratricopeptide repeat-containing sensor histidine kinase [Pontibacter litorisediminis]|uniref:tetratricopeptide repeat-containing sensor histidine kinase n=1 Tax=Pontibacter litorisediminis TaxID=1846260 RepID=UPI0023EBEA63|nr:tetratricopeptide repeat-containing sensor histidine kinase [Pontibacter litorisediminis]
MKQLVFLSLLLFLFSAQAQTDKIANLKAELEATTDANEQVFLLCDLSKQYWNSSFSTSLKYGNQAVALAQELGNKKALALAFNNIGVAYDIYGNYSEASRYYYKSLRIREAIGDSAGLSASYNNIATAYATQGDLEKSSELYAKSLEISTAMNDTKGVALALGNLGSIYQQQKDLDKALEYIQRGLNLLDPDDPYSLINLNNIGFIYSEKGDWGRALSYHHKALNTARKVGSKMDEAYSLSGLAEAYMAADQPEMALPYALQNVELLIKLNSKDEVKLAAETLNKLYVRLGDFKNAHKYLTLQNQYADSVQQASVKTQLAELEFKYENEKAVQENLLLKAQTSLQQQMIERRNTAQLFTGALLLLVCVLAVVFFLGRRRMHRLNDLLVQKNKDVLEHSTALTLQKEQLAEQADLLREQKEELEKLNSVKDKLFSVIAHDLKSPLTSLQGLLQLIAKGAVPQDKLKPFMASLEASQQNSLWLLDNLLLWSRMQMRGLTVKPEKTELAVLVQQNIRLLEPQAKFKELEFRYDIAASHQLYADKEMVNLVLRNLIGNAIKFSKKGGGICISSELRDEWVTISVQDTGIGMTPEKLASLFDGHSISSSKGTADERGSGLGLQLCQYFIERNSGSVWAESEAGVGSTFLFRLPAAVTNEPAEARGEDAPLVELV